jgi:hypothetical protein
MKIKIQYVSEGKKRSTAHQLAEQHAHIAKR